MSAMSFWNSYNLEAAYYFKRSIYTIVTEQECLWHMLYARSSLRHYDLRGSGSDVVPMNHVAELFKFVMTYDLLTAKIPLPAMFPA